MPESTRSDCMNYRGYGVVCLKGAGHDGACGGHLAGCRDGFDCGCPNEIHKPTAGPPDAHLEKLMDELELATIDAQTWPSRPFGRLRAARSALREYVDERTLTEREIEGLLWCLEDGAGRRYFNGQAYINLRAKLRRRASMKEPE